jgi:hypothetical protein
MTPEEARRIVDAELGWEDDDYSPNRQSTLKEPIGTSVEALALRLRDSPGDYVSSTVDKRHRYPLERGWTKHQLIHELAAQTKTISLLAKEYGVVHSGIINFRTRHAAEILAVQQNLADRFASIPLARKENRLAEYQQDIEDINALQQDAPGAELTRIKHNALKNMAEEMGHLPSKTNVQVNAVQVTYAVEGVDPDAFK